MYNNLYNNFLYYLYNNLYDIIFVFIAFYPILYHLSSIYLLHFKAFSFSLHLIEPKRPKREMKSKIRKKNVQN